MGIIDAIDKMVGRVHCISKRGRYKPEKTDRQEQRLENAKANLRQSIYTRVFGRKFCSINSAHQVTADKFFTWINDKNTFPKFIRECQKISKFLLRGCKEGAIENNLRLIENGFERYRAVVNTLVDKKCFGKQGKVIRVVGDF